MCRETVMHKLPARRKPRPGQFADARGQHPTSLYCECTYTNSLGAAGGKNSSGESWRSSFAGRFCLLWKRKRRARRASHGGVPSPPDSVRSPPDSGLSPPGAEVRKVLRWPRSLKGARSKSIRRKRRPARSRSRSGNTRAWLKDRQSQFCRGVVGGALMACLLYTSPSPRDRG